MKYLPFEIEDEFTNQFSAQVCPESWQNPIPAEWYDLVVIGAGPAGLSAAREARRIGARVALIEKHAIGGIGFWYDCVSTRALIAIARIKHLTDKVAQYGILFPNEGYIESEQVLKCIRRGRTILSHSYRVQELQEQGIDIFFGSGSFVAADQIAVGNDTLRFKKAIIATGSFVSARTLSGLHKTGYKTGSSLFGGLRLPERVALIGSDAHSFELAQALARLDIEVTIFELRGEPRFHSDSTVVNSVKNEYVYEKIRMVSDCIITGIELHQNEKHICYEQLGVKSRLQTDEIILVSPRVAGIVTLAIEKAGVTLDDDQRIIVNEFFQTTNENIHAAGDCCGTLKNTIWAELTGACAARNALLSGQERVDASIIPRCVYTDPEIAEVGLDREELNSKGIEFDENTFEIKSGEYHLTSDAYPSFIQCRTRKRTDKLLGVTIVADHASELIYFFNFALTHNLGLYSLSKITPPFFSMNRHLTHVARQFEPSPEQIPAPVNTSRFFSELQKWLQKRYKK